MRFLLLPILLIPALLVFAVFQLVAGFQGIEHHLGAVWAWLALIAAFIFRFTFPITIGAFFGAMNVWGWHWAFALLFAAPGIVLGVVFLMPALFAGLLALISLRGIGLGFLSARPQSTSHPRRGMVDITTETKENPVKKPKEKRS